MARQATQHPLHHLRPVARRLPVGRRSSRRSRRPMPTRWRAKASCSRRHYAGAAPCSPARACLYTGLYQMNNRVCRNGTPLDGRHDNIALRARARSATIRRCSATPTCRPIRAASRRAIRCCASYEGVLPGFSVRQLLPEHQKPWLSWLAARGVDVSRRLSRHPPPGRRRRRERVERTARLFARRDADGVPGRRVHPLARRAGRRPGSRISPSSARTRPSSCRNPSTRCTTRTDGPAFARHDNWQDEAGSHPFSPTLIGAQAAAKFLPGIEGQGARPRTRRDSARSARSTTA